jgi:hypothetical protein
MKGKPLYIDKFCSYVRATDMLVLYSLSWFSIFRYYDLGFLFPGPSFG